MAPQLSTQFHAVWDRYGSSFGSTHTDVLTKLKAAGASWVRVDIAWGVVEPTQGSFVSLSSIYGGKLGGTLDWCAANGLTVLITLLESPTWAIAAGAPTKRLPITPSNCQGIGTYMANQSVGRPVAGIEFWNEPDLTGFDDLGPRPSHYIDCLHYFFAGVNASTNPGLPVLFGAPSSVAYVSGSTDAKANFLGLAYDAMDANWAGERAYDVMAVHCYPGLDAPSVASTGTQTWRVDHLDFLRSKMTAEGDTRDIWITEGGYSAHTNEALGGVTPPPYQQGVTEAQQGTLEVAYIDKLETDHPYVKRMSFYNEWEKGEPTTATTNVDRHEFGYGWLQFADRATTKPVYGALQARYVGSTGDDEGVTLSWRRNDFRLAPGTGITTANSAGSSSGDAFDTQAGTTTTVSTTAYGPGAMEASLTAGTLSYLGWTWTNGVNVAFRTYVRIPSAPLTFNARLIRGVQSGGTMAFEVRANSSGQFDIINTAGVSLGVSKDAGAVNYNYAAGQFYRLDGYINYSTGASHLDVFVGTATGTPAATINPAASTFATVTEVRFGFMLNTAGTGTIIHDNVALDETYPIGPVPPPAAVTGASQGWVVGRVAMPAAAGGWV